MRVITGSARGRRIETLTGEDVRPTAERVKEAVFSMIQFQVEQRRFWICSRAPGRWESKP